MPNQSTRSSSSRKEAAGAKFYDNFLETFIKICDEEDVCRVPEIVIVDKSGLEIAEPETISRKLSEIIASLENEKAQRAAEEALAMEDESSTESQRKVHIDADSEPTIDEAPVEKNIRVAEGEGESYVPVKCPEEEICRRKKGQLKVVSGRPETLTALAMRSLKIESALLRTLGRCLLWFGTISQLRLENCRLKPEDVFLIAVVLRETDSVKQLILDENPLGDMCYSCLMQMSSNLQLLSLCSCGLGDLGVNYLSTGLEHTDIKPHPLVRLNLASNLITSKGAQILANALRTNRALLSLTLSGNQIQTTGAIALAEVFQRFQLRQDEVMERRGRYFSQNLRQTSRNGVLEDLYPFLTELEREDGAQYCKGNFKLMHLNLSYNSIGLPGLLAFHQAVLYQEEVLQPPDKGLLSLYLRGNSFPENRPELEEMLRILEARLEFQRKGSKTSTHESSSSSSKTSVLS